MNINNLVAVQRADKTGKMVTRHVRASSLAKGAVRLPAPIGAGSSVGTKSAAKKTTEQAAQERRKAAMDKPKKRSFSAARYSILPSAEYDEHEATTYKFECSDNDFYSVLEHFTVDDAIVLSAAGAAAEKISKVARRGGKAGTGSAQNSELVAELRERAIPMDVFCARYFENRYMAMNQPTRFLDAAECASLSVFRKDTDLRDKITRHVEHRTIALSDVKDIGIHLIPDSNVALIRALMEIRDGESLSTAEEIRKVIDRPDRNEWRTKQRLAYCVEYGAEFAATIRYPIMSMLLEDDASDMEHEDAKSFLSYADACFYEEPDSFMEASVDKEGMLELWRSGLSSEVARDGMERGMTARQIIAVNQHGVIPAVSDGWL